ncbi:MAG: DUF2298 domain-containing protein, partial [Acidobacteriota bacterium]|nr:DUF2298 domain-containing protein [Acidobacteriota bacterium]
GAPGLALGSLGSALIWLLALLLVGAVTLPIAYVLFPNLADRGAGLAKPLGLAAATYVLAFSVEAGLLRNGAGAATASFLLLTAAGVIAFVRRRRELVLFWRENRRLLLAGEAVFGFGFLLFLALRALNPEIFWGEKPMDFSILNILVRSNTLPPSDPWFAGAPLGYYVFGQQTVAVLTLLTGLSTRYTFNLAFGLLGGFVAQGAFSLARNWAGTWRAGWMGAGFTLLLGNLSGLREFLVNRRPLDWHYFWATSRVIPDTINEYPLWSLLFADLHAHVLALPFFLLVLASALQLLRAHADPSAGAKRRLVSALLLGFAVMVHALTNAWDIPLLAGLVLLTAIVAAGAGSVVSRVEIGRAAVSLAVASASAIVLGLTLWVRGGGPPGFGWNAERGARGVDVMTHFGFFFFLAFAWLATSIASKFPPTETEKGGLRRGLVYGVAALVLASGFLSVELLCVAGILLFLFALFRIAGEPEERLASGLVAAAFFLVLLPQRAFIFDRMNTFFKLYFEAWVLFAVSTVVLVFGAWARGTFGRWPLLLRGLFFLLLAAATFTSITAVRGDLFGQGNPSRPLPASGLSLDGLRYLEKWRPGEYLAVEWLRREIPGTPVILEAQGPSYQAFSRVSMLTGIPTVLGWEHHVKQRGNPESEVEARRGHIRQIYSSSDTRGIPELLRRYHVGYIYVGAIEREAYPSDGLKKFAEATDLFQIAYENPDVRIYRVVGGDSEDVISPVKETLPVAEKPRGAPQDEPEDPPEIRETPNADVPAFSGLREPRDAAVDDRGRLWIADFGNSRLRIFQPDGGFLGGWGGRGSGTFGLKEPCAVAVSGNDVYIADTWNGRVQHFTIAGEWKGSAGDLYGPRGIAVGPDGSVWVSDTGNKRIAIFDRDLKPLRTIGKLGSGPLEFSDPVGIAVGPSGSVHVADAGNGRIQILDAKGAFKRSIAVPKWNRNVEPHLEVGDDGTIYASDPQGDALLVFSASGELQDRRATDDSGRPLARPTGVAIDRKNRILYVVNSGNNGISKWSLAEEGGP